MRDVEELMAERGLSVDHSTVWRWVQAYAPERHKRLQGQLKYKRSVFSVDGNRSYRAAIRQLDSEGEFDRKCRYRRSQ
jgi:transposase-like protein